MRDSGGPPDKKTIAGEQFERRSVPSTGKKHPAPFCLRLSFEERAILEKAAGGMPLGAYIRSRLFEKELPPRRQQGRNSVKDHRVLGQVLGQLGKSRLANNLNQLARAANTGSLPVTPDTEAAIRDACAQVQQIRADILKALGLSPGPEP